MKVPLARTIDDCTQEVTFEYSRSPGPGGQHVNKVATQATLCFDVPGSRVLSDRQKEQIQQRLGTRISGSGLLRVRSRKYRSQSANRQAAIRRFGELVAAALTPAKRRVGTRPSRSSRERRIREKKRRGQIKRTRAGRLDD